MPKKRVKKQLDRLFSTLDQAAIIPATEAIQPPPGWTWECDASGRYTSCSPEVESVLGLSPKELIGKDFRVYALAAQSVTDLQAAISGDLFPAEVSLNFQSLQGLITPVRMVLFRYTDENDALEGWRGFAQVLPIDLINKEKPAPATPDSTVSALSTQPSALLLTTSMSLGTAGIQPAYKIWTQAGVKSLALQKPMVQAASSTTPAAIAVPVEIQGKTAGIIEIVDDAQQRKWNDDEIQLAYEVIAQLALALENSQLYAAAQLELNERIRAEGEILNRNKDLATLNQIGQQLNRLASPSEILDLIFSAIGQVVDNSNLLIALYDETNQYISFPIYTVDGQPQVISGHPFGNGLIEHVITTLEPVILQKDVPQELRKMGVFSYGRPPLSLLAVPMLAGETVVGVILLQDYLKEGAFTAIHAELLSTIASQATIALENARLFQDMQEALITIEVRERYQKNVASAVTALAEYGTQSIQDVLRMLGDAAQTSRVYYVRAEQDESGTSWQIVNEWLSEGVPSLIAMNGFQRLPVERYPFLANELEEQGKFSGLTAIMPSPEDELLKSLGIRSFLALLVNNKSQLPSFIGFDEIHYDRPWSTEELDTLQMAAVSLSNTIIREDLLTQLKASLDETTLLFQTSRLISQSQGEIELYQTSLEACFNGVKSNFLAIYSLITEGEESFLTRLTYLSDQSITNHPEDDKIRVGDFPLIDLLNSGQAIVSRNIQADQRLNETGLSFFSRNNLASVFLNPLVVRTQVFGVLLAARTEIQPYSPSEMTFIQTVVAQLTVALDNYNLLQATQRSATEAHQRSEELSLLNRILSTVSSSLNMHAALQIVIDELFKLLPLSSGGIALINEDRMQLTLLADRRRNGESQVGSLIPLDSNPGIQQVIETRQTVIGSRAQEIPQAEPVQSSATSLPTHTLALIPLLAGNEVFGTVNLELDDDAPALNPDQLRLAETIVLQAAMAIQNARLYEVAQEAIVEMRELDLLKSQFLANVSHELRTPLNAIIGFSRVILKGIDGPVTTTQQADLNAIYDSGQHLLRLINDILDLSKIEAGKMELANEDVNLVDLINSTVSTATGLVKDKPIELRCQVPADLPLVKGDPNRVRQVLINLISNAAKFTEQGAITIAANTQITQENKPEMVVTVDDTGSGIAPRDQARLFQPFSQVDGSPNRETGGTGLGLSISRSLIELQGGKIGLLRSEVGVGSTFYFTLPLKPGAMVKETLPQVEIPQVKPTLLMIDDDPQVISLYEHYLQPYGYQVIPLTDPVQALAMAQSVCPMVITLDILMPEVNGWQVLKDLKADPKTKDIPVIICSILEEREKAAGLGAMGYLVKPFLPDDLIHAVQRVRQIA